MQRRVSVSVSVSVSVGVGVGVGMSVGVGVGVGVGMSVSMGVGMSVKCSTMSEWHQDLLCAPARRRVYWCTGQQRGQWEVQREAQRDATERMDRAAGKTGGTKRQSRVCSGSDGASAHLNAPAVR